MQKETLVLEIRVLHILFEIDFEIYANFCSDWEDRKLGNYLTSETRFEEIIEHICDDSEVRFVK